MKTKSYRDQHERMLMLAGQISQKLDLNALSKDASEVRNILSQLLGLLNIHLAMEDKALYPSMLSHSDAQISQTAKKFQEEMGGIGAVVGDYNKKWSSALKIQDNPSAFISESKNIFSALAKRIDRENNQLYPLFDKS